MSKRQTINPVFLFVALTAIYFAAGKLGLSLASRNESASAFWPATGLALAAMLVLGHRYWPSIFVGALLVNLTTPKHLAFSSNFITSVAIAGGNTLEALVGALLARMFSKGLASFEKTDDVFRFVVFAAIPSTAISATIGITALAFVGNLSAASYAPVWFTWWMGDFTSDLLVAPLLIVWASHRWITIDRNTLIEAVALILSTLAVSFFVFGGPIFRGHHEYPLEYLTIPLLIWAAFRFTQIGAMTSALLISCVAVIGTWRGIGPFVVGDRNDSMVLLQMFVGVATLTALVLATAIAERQRDQLEREALLKREASARAEAERANNAKDQFLAVLSHELRTPLTPVMISASMLEADRDLPEHLREDAQTIRQNVELEARLIDDLLDLTRVTRGKLQLQMQSTDLHRIIRRALDIRLRDAPMKVIVKLDAKRARVHGDPARLQQIFWNLFNNARKFTPEDGTITIHSRESGDAIEVEVTDTGEGIEPELLPKLFNAFEQGEAARSGKSGGLGLGLAISKALVIAHKGTLSAHSAGRGSGSTFILRFPLLASPLVEHREPAEIGLPASASSRSLRILLVEDHQDTLGVMKRLLLNWKHQVTCATSVASAVKALKDDQFDLLISDLGLPDGLGYDIMRSVKERLGIHGIALSGYGMDSDINKSREAGFAEHLTKPISIDALEAAIARATR